MKGKAKVDAILAKTNGLKKQHGISLGIHLFGKRKLFRIWWQEDTYKITLSTTPIPFINKINKKIQFG